VSLFVLFLVFGRNQSASFKMDDRDGPEAVTDLFREFFRMGPSREIFVTARRARLSSSLVWTGLTLHG
jgi:hypothetical protein